MKDAQAFLKNNWKWGNLSERQETLSGSGSTMANTVNIRRELPLLVNKWNIHSIFDAPCGDGKWMSKTELNASYCGGDLVDSFVSTAKDKGLNVYNFDIRTNPFPPVDLWLCRACWYHLPFADITATVNNWLNSSIKLSLHNFNHIFTKVVEAFVNVILLIYFIWSSKAQTRNDFCF